MKRKNKIKSIINDLDITPLLRFLLWRNVLLSSTSFLSSHFLPPFFLLSSLDIHFHRFSYLPSTFSNSFLIYLNILPQIFDHPTHIITLPCTSLVTLFFYTHLPPLFVISLLFPLVQTLLSVLLHFSSFLSFPRYPPQL